MRAWCGWMVGLLGIGCDAAPEVKGPGDEVEIVSAGTCDVQVAAAVPFETVLSARYGCAAPGVPGGEVIATEARWAEWLDEVGGCLVEGVAPAEVDFATQVVLVAGASAFATSGFALHGVEVGAGPGGAHLEAVFTDPYGACDTQPGASGAWVVAVAVSAADAGAAPTVCRKTRRVCGD